MRCLQLERTDSVLRLAPEEPKRMKPKRKPTAGTDRKVKDIAISRLVTLRRNPQYLTEKQQSALRDSIQRDGFLVPLVVRKKSGTTKLEVISGNHRFMAAKDCKFERLPCVVIECTDAEAQRIAVNLNTVHGDPEAELLAPFLAEMDDEAMAGVYLGAELFKGLVDFDTVLAARLSELEAPDAVERDSSRNSAPDCKCSKCGKMHVKKSASVD